MTFWSVFLNPVTIINYRMAQIWMGENIDEFDEFPAIRQYFPHEIFHLVSYLLLVNLW